MPDSADANERCTPIAGMRLEVCSTNAGKLRDFALYAQACGQRHFLVEPLPGLSKIPAPDENGSSFEENAIVKAVYYSAFTPELVLADDSGLEVAALDGAPGIYSARYAGAGATDADNNTLLLSRLSKLSCRDARFVCVLAVAQNRSLLLTARGAVDGKILAAPRGNGGFGYDPLFFYPPLQCSFAELTPDQKFSVSHRGAALRQLFPQLDEIVHV